MKTNLGETFAPSSFLFGETIQKSQKATISREVLKCDPRSSIWMIHTIQRQTEFSPVQHCYCHLNKECNLNQSKDNSFVGRVAKNNT